MLWRLRTSGLKLLLPRLQGSAGFTSCKSSAVARRCFSTVSADSSPFTAAAVVKQLTMIPEVQQADAFFTARKMPEAKECLTRAKLISSYIPDPLAGAAIRMRLAAVLRFQGVREEEMEERKAILESVGGKCTFQMRNVRFNSARGSATTSGHSLSLLFVLYVCVYDSNWWCRRNCAGRLRTSSCQSIFYVGSPERSDCSVH